MGGLWLPCRIPGHSVRARGALPLAHSDASTDWYQESSFCHLRDILCVVGSLRLGGSFLTLLPCQRSMVPKAEQAAVQEVELQFLGSSLLSSNAIDILSSELRG